MDIDLRTGEVLRWSNLDGNLKVALPPGRHVTHDSHYTRGSHKDDVLRLQGTPTSIQTYSSLGHEQWGYGLVSSVDIDLRTGEVLRWSNLDGSLKVALPPGRHVTHDSHYTRGSHKDDVLRLQGTPTSIQTYSSLGHEQWGYGLVSSVDIDLRTGKVLKWSNLDGRLKVRM